MEKHYNKVIFIIVFFMFNCNFYKGKYKEYNYIFDLKNYLKKTKNINIDSFCGVVDSIPAIELNNKTYYISVDIRGKYYCGDIVSKNTRRCCYKVDAQKHISLSRTCGVLDNDNEIFYGLNCYIDSISPTLKDNEYDIYIYSYHKDLNVIKKFIKLSYEKKLKIIFRYENLKYKKERENLLDIK